MGSQKNIRTQLTSYRIKMEGCMSSLVKYLLFTTNFLIFILGTAVFGLGIWVVVDKPSFLDLFEQASDQLGDGESFNVEIYTSAAYILLVVSALVVIISFFGCCGAQGKQVHAWHLLHLDS